MADVTDVAFRRIIAKYGKPDVTWTEFVSADGLVLAPEAGRKKLLKDLEYDESERPIVAQLFSSRPENMEKAARLCLKLGFDGVDINMGCPDRAIERQGCGSAMIKNPELAKEIILAAKRGASDGSKSIPVSVKTRLGYNKDELETWLPHILSAEPAVVTIHARTRKEMSLVPARWERVKRAVEIRNELGSKTLIVGNGDALDLLDAMNKARETGADGVMLGRAIFGNPWLFDDLTRLRSHPLLIKERGGKSDGVRRIPLEERLRVMLEHSKLFEKYLGGIKNFAIMKKHFKSYVGDIPNAKDLRMKLMDTNNADEVEKVIEEFMRWG